MEELGGAFRRVLYTLRLEANGQLVADNASARFEERRVQEAAREGPAHIRGDCAFPGCEWAGAEVTVLRCVPDVIELRPELSAEALADANILDQVDIPVLETGNAFQVAASISGAPSVGR